MTLKWFVKTKYLLVFLLLLAQQSICAELTDAIVNKEIARLQKSNLDDMVILCKKGNAGQRERGMCALKLLSLIESNYDKNNQALQQAVNFIKDPVLYKDWEYVSAYTVGLVVYALCDYDPIAYKEEIEALIEILEIHSANGHWGDQSRNQYAVLGLGIAKKRGFEVSEKVLNASKTLWENTYNQKGWGYSASSEAPVTLSMSCAGIASLSLLGDELYTADKKCGIYEENRLLSDSLAGLVGQLKADRVRISTYALYSLERVAIFLDLKTIGGMDWYRFGAELIINGTYNHENKNYTLGKGSASGEDPAFRLLFLAKGFKPIAITKWQWGQEGNEDWNNDRHDVRNWIEVFNKEQKKKFDWLPSELDGVDSTAAKASMVFVSGHGQFDLKENEVDFLRSFLKKKGSLVAEACCGKKIFQNSFVKAFHKKLYPGQAVKFNLLPASHEVYHKLHDVKASDMPIYRLQLGCRKTRILLLGKDISCTLNGEPASKAEKELARKVSQNILAWSLASKKADKRLDNTLLNKLKYVAPKKDVKEEKLSDINQYNQPIVRLLHAGDAGADPHLFAELREMLEIATSKRVSLDAELLFKASANDIFSAALLYLTGHTNPKFSRAELKNLKRYVENGGTLFSVACCSEKKYNEAIYSVLELIFPTDSLRDIPLTDPLYKAFSGEILQLTKGTVTSGYYKKYSSSLVPLKGISRDGRWVVIHSPYDLCCDIEGDLEDDVVALKKSAAVKMYTSIFYYILSL